MQVGLCHKARLMTTELRGKWALVTGASRGVGKQIARGLAGLGCNLVLHSRDAAHTRELEAELAGQGVRVSSVSGELSEQAAVDRMLDSAITVSGGIDILYNNAAIMTPFRASYIETPAEDFRLSFEVNVITPIRITYRLLPTMLERRWGRIVQVTSGIQDQPELMAYAASKAALDKFVRDTVPSLRGTGVLMNLLDPGWLRTDLGGPRAPNAVESVLPGALVPALVDGEVHGVFFRAQDHARPAATSGASST
ncbi:short-chain dehydrogenase [Sorangium cellulosum]|uniref:Short-chain dehydrogenase n=2 Tax=Sorangium cellulosum TaxID=56 RepID=A0A4V0NDV6_SORCE|nr:short-chain dehydrogenase [Sorangium cellulosum]